MVRLVIVQDILLDPFDHTSLILQTNWWCTKLKGKKIMYTFYFFSFQFSIFFSSVFIFQMQYFHENGSENMLRITKK